MTLRFSDNNNTVILIDTKDTAMTAINLKSVR